jgi:hypothetical protein
MSSLPSVPPLQPISGVNPVQPYFIAIVIDDVAQQVMNIDGQTAAMFLSNPKFIQCDGTVAAGMVYNQNAGTWSLPTK